MENASKALIIAGTILITLIIISLGVLVFRNMSGTVEKNANLSTEVIAQFNAKITPYIGTNVSGSQVNALIQIVRAIDQKAITNNDNVQRVTISGSSGASVKINGNKVEYSTVETGKYYQVSETYDDNSGLITQITVN